MHMQVVQSFFSELILSFCHLKLSPSPDMYNGVIGDWQDIDSLTQRLETAWWFILLSAIDS